MKKGTIVHINEKNNNVARLATGEIVLGTKDQPMKVGNIVSYTTEKQTQRYAVQRDLDNGTVQSLVDANGNKVLVPIPVDEQRDVNRVAAVYQTQEDFVRIFAQEKMLDVHVEKEVKKQITALELLYA